MVVGSLTHPFLLVTILVAVIKNTRQKQLKKGRVHFDSQFKQWGAQSIMVGKPQERA